MDFTTRMPFLLKVVISAFAVAVLAFAIPVDAGTIDFDQASGQAPSGTIMFDGGGIGVGTVTGSDIVFGRILGVDTPFNNMSELTCTACTLDFQTGTLVDVIVSGPITTYIFGGAGDQNFVSLDGEVEPDAGGSPPHPGTGPGNIVSGFFTSATLVVGPGGTFTFLANRGISDTKDTALVEYYFGIGSNDPPLQFVGSTTELGGTGAFGAGGSFTSTRLTLADFANEVPEPSATLLFLLGLAGIAGYGYRNRLS